MYKENKFAQSNFVLAGYNIYCCENVRMLLIVHWSFQWFDQLNCITDLRHCMVRNQFIFGLR